MPLFPSGTILAQQPSVTSVPSQILPPEVENTEINSFPEENARKKKKKPKKKSKKPVVPLVNASETVQPVRRGVPTELPELMGTDGNPANVKSLAVSESSSGIREDGSYLDPFTSQLSHIDAIREGLNNPNSYYAQVKARMKAGNDKDATQAERSKKVGNSCFPCIVVLEKLTMFSCLNLR